MRGDSGVSPLHDREFYTVVMPSEEELSPEHTEDFLNDVVEKWLGLLERMGRRYERHSLARLWIVILISEIKELRVTRIPVPVPPAPTAATVTAGSAEQPRPDYRRTLLFSGIAQLRCEC